MGSKEILKIFPVLAGMIVFMVLVLLAFQAGREVNGNQWRTSSKSAHPGLRYCPFLLGESAVGGFLLAGLVAGLTLTDLLWSFAEEIGNDIVMFSQLSAAGLAFAGYVLAYALTAQGLAQGGRRFFPNLSPSLLFVSLAVGGSLISGWICKSLFMGCIPALGCILPMTVEHSTYNATPWIPSPEWENFRIHAAVITGWILIALILNRRNLAVSVKSLPARKD